MSYILEALKKAQAERQLGTAPSIHTMPIPTASSDRTARDRTPLLIAGGAIALGLVAAALWWRQGQAGAPQEAAAVLAEAPAAQPAVIVVPPSPPKPVQAAEPPAPAPRAAPAPAPVPARPAHVSPAYVPPIPPAAPPARTEKPAPVPAPAAAAEPAPEENLPTMAQLPEAVQSQLPKVTFGGYMYSKNPADRLLLIDKVLRHEGEEVAPGLVLEQLQPRAAVMNFRGTRYRVAY